MASTHNHLVIMAGGIGSRFWPMSTPENPKQFIDALGLGRTFLQQTFDNFSGVVPPENVWVVTSQAYRESVVTQLPEIPVGNILLEPCRRNTAPCIAYVAWRIKKQDPKANLVVSPSDHFIRDKETFRQVIAEALDFTAASDAIITLGMQPSRPETGYGYIQADLSAPSLRNKRVYRVDSFKEKPDLATAMQYIKNKEYYWNSGIFIWNVHTIVNSIRIYAPEIADVFETLFPQLGTAEEQDLINAAFPRCPNISIDYAILEKADEIFVMPADFGWSDVGTWTSLLQLAPKDDRGNAAIGPCIRLYDTHNCIIHTSEEREVVVQGLQDYIVAEHAGTLLICRLSDEQRIKDFSQEACPVNPAGPGSQS